MDDKLLKKLPKPFSAEILVSEYEKNIKGKFFTKHDEDYFNEYYELKEDKYILKKEIDKETIKIFKEIASNLKKKRPKNILKPFSENIKADVFEKKIVKKIYIKKDKEFIYDIYSKTEDGKFYKLDRELYTAELIRLNEIAKAVSKNVGGIFNINLIIFILLIAGLYYFNVYLKDKLIETYLRNFLQGIFDARVDFKNLKFRFLNAQLKFDSLTIADSDEVMKNLVEFGKTEIRLNFKQLLFGKFVVENIQFDNIKFGTERKISGALPPKKVKPKKESKKVETKKEENKDKQNEDNLKNKKDLIKIPDLSNINPQKLINDNITNLKTIILLSNAELYIISITNKWLTKYSELESNIKEKAKITNQTKQEINTFTKKWNDNFSNFMKTIDNSTLVLQDIKQINPANIKTPEQLQEVLLTVQKGYTAIENVKNDSLSLYKNFNDDLVYISNKIDEVKLEVNKTINEVNNLYKLFNEDLKTIEKMINEFQKAIDEDYKYIVSLAKLPEGGIKALLEQMVDSFIRQKLGKNYKYYVKVRRYLEKTKAKKKDEEKKKVKKEVVRRKGRDIIYPTPNYPKFLIKNVQSSILSADNRKEFALRIIDITLEPDRWGKPYQLFLTNRDNEKIFNLFALYDARSNISMPANIDIKFLENDIYYEDETLKVINIQSMNGKYDINTRLQISSNADIIGRANIILKNLSCKAYDDNNIFSRYLIPIFTNSGDINIDLQYKMDKNFNLDLNASTSIDNKFKEVMNNLFKQLLGDFEKFAKQELMKIIEPELKKNKDLYNAFNKLKEYNDKGIKDLEGIKKEISNQIMSLAKIDERKKEIENIINNKKKEIDDKKKEIEDTYERYKKELLDKIEKEKKALEEKLQKEKEEAERKAKEEAQKQLEKQLDKLKPKLKF